MSRPIWTCLGSYIELGITRGDVLSISHPGNCDDDVERVMRKPYIKRQLVKLTDENLRAELKEYGAWDDKELQDRELNLARVVWLAAGNIAEEIAE